MKNNDKNQFERRLILEIERIGRQISELEQERLALQRQLTKARTEVSALKDVNRKNSVTRVLVEDLVLKELSVAAKPLKPRELFKAGLYANHRMNESTFRTYLYRMKEKGMIKRVRTGWVQEA